MGPTCDECDDLDDPSAGGRERVKSRILLTLLLLSIVVGCGPRLPPPATRVPVPTPTPTPEPAPPPAPTPTPQPPAPRPEPPAAALEPILLKVGIASDLEAVTLPCCEEPLTAAVEGQALAVTGPLRIEPAAASTQAG